MIISSIGKTTKRKQHCYWVNDTQITKLNKGIRNVIAFPCADFRNKLLSLSKLKCTSPYYVLLEELMTRFLQFEKRTRNVDNGGGRAAAPTSPSAAPASSTTHCRRYSFRRRRRSIRSKNDNNDEKLQAIVAGSYPAYLGKVLKQYADVDVFVVVKESDLKVFNALWKVMQGDNSAGFNVGDVYELAGYQRVLHDILATVNFGKVQLIFRYYSCECQCDYHVDNSFFSDFHHCTRWKLDVFKNFIIPRYIHLEDDGGEIICEKTALTTRYEKVVILNWQGRFKSFTHPKKYPIKHLDNVIDFGPPSLKQQALHRVFRCCSKTTKEPIENATTAASCSRKRKQSKGDKKEDTDDLDWLMCSEEMGEQLVFNEAPPPPSPQEELLV